MERWPRNRALNLNLLEISGLQREIHVSQTRRRVLATLVQPSSPETQILVDVPRGISRHVWADGRSHGNRPVGYTGVHSVRLVCCVALDRWVEGGTLELSALRKAVRANLPLSQLLDAPLYTLWP